MATHKSDLLTWIKGDVLEETVDCSPKSLKKAVLLPEMAFARMLRLERRRAERSGRAFIFVQIGYENVQSMTEAKLLGRVIGALAGTTRETDLLGWYKTGSILGLLMTEIGDRRHNAIETITHKILRAIQEKITDEEFRALSFQFGLFPHEVEKSSDIDRGHIHYPDISRQTKSKYDSGQMMKRVVDVAGSLMAIIVLVYLG